MRHLPGEVSALLGIAQVTVHYTDEPGLFRLRLANKYGERWSGKLPERDLHMFGVMEIHLRELMANIDITLPLEHQ